MPTPPPTHTPLDLSLMKPENSYKMCAYCMVVPGYTILDFRTDFMTNFVTNMSFSLVLRHVPSDAVSSSHGEAGV